MIDSELRELTQGTLGFLAAFAFGGLILTFVGCVILATCRSTSAAMRFFIGQSSLIGVIMLALIVAMTPGIELMSWPDSGAIATRTESTATTATDRTLEPDLPEFADLPGSGLGPTQPYVRSGYSQRMDGDLGIERRNVAMCTADASEATLVIIWFVGCVWLLVRFVRSLIKVRNIQAKAREWPKAAHALADSVLALAPTKRPLGSRGTQISVLLSSDFPLPFTGGVLRPVIVLPEAARHWPKDTLGMVLRHEVAHIDRRDVCWCWCSQIACALAWFNPLVWMLTRFCGYLREQACDDRVLNSGAAPDAYAACLVSISRSLQARNIRMAGSVAMARPPLRRRIDSVLAKDVNRHGGSLRFRLGIGSLLLCTTVVLSLLRPPGHIAEAASPLQDQRPAQATTTTTTNSASPTGLVARMGSSWLRHAESVHALAFSPEGRWLASGGSDRYVNIWDLRNQEMRTLEGNEKGSMGHDALAFSADGTRLAAITGDGRLRVWDLDTGSLLWEEKYADGYAPTRVAFTHDGRRIVSCGREGRGVISNAASGSMIRTLEVHLSDNGISSGLAIAISPDDSQLAMGSWQGIELISLADEERGRIPEAHGAAITSLDYTQDGRQLLSCGYSLDNNRVAIAERKLWRLEDRTFVRSFDTQPAHEGLTFGGISKNGTLVATAGRAIVTWDLATGRQTARVLNGKATANWSSRAFTISPTGSSVAAPNGAEILLWDASTGGRLFEEVAGHAAPVTDICFSQDGRWIASGGRNGAVLLWENSGRAFSKRLPLAETPLSTVRSIAFDSDDELLLATGSCRFDRHITGGVALWETATGKLITSREVEGRGQVAVFSNARSQILIGAGIGGNGEPFRGFGSSKFAPAKMHFFDRELALSHGSSPNLTGRAIAMYAESDKDQVYAVTEDGQLVHWNTRTQRLDAFPISILASPSISNARLNSAVFSADGTQLATSGLFHNEVLVWDSASGERLASFTYDNTKGCSLAFSPDGSLLAIAPIGLTRTKQEYAKNLIVWDIQRDKRVREFEVSMPHISSVEFSPDGKEIVTGHTNGTLSLWQVME